MPIQIQDIHDQDDIVDCPLCMETLEVDDINFFPCECGYQICRFCWHRIRTDGNGLCPACRKVGSNYVLHSHWSTLVHCKCQHINAQNLLSHKHNMYMGTLTRTFSL